MTDIDVTVKHNIKFDYALIENVNINLYNVENQVKDILLSHNIKDKTNRAAWLMRAVSCIDLTTLAGDDTKCNVRRLCYKAATPLPLNCHNGVTEDYEKFTTAAVCVYPSRVADAAEALKSMNLPVLIQIAAVATGFPTGQYSLETRLKEITFAVDSGATEIDVVIDRSLVLTGKWDLLFDELRQMREACGETHMKVILAIGELGTMTNVYKAAMVSMHAGCDFIKTSTGKEGVNATLAVGLVMCRAIAAFQQQTGKKIGLKPAGGIRTSQDAINWLILVKTQLGDEWLTPELFRIGASGLLGDIENWFHTLNSKVICQSSKFSFI